MKFRSQSSKMDENQYVRIKSIENWNKYQIRERSDYVTKYLTTGSA